MIFLQLPSDRSLGAALLALFVICVCLGYIARLVYRATKEQRAMLNRHPSATVRGKKPAKVVDMKLDEIEDRISS